MTTTVEVKVTDGGSIDATTTKLVKLRDVKKEIESGTGKGGAAAIKSVADAADQGAAKFQKATGAMQNFAAATGNPLLMKGASMFNGLAAGLGKVEGGALGAAKAMKAMMIVSGIGAVIAAISALAYAFNSASDSATRYGALASDAVDDVASAVKELTKASLAHQALNTAKTAKDEADAYVNYAEKLKIAATATRELTDSTLTAMQTIGSWLDKLDNLFDRFAVNTGAALGVKVNKVRKEAMDGIDAIKAMAKDPAIAGIIENAYGKKASELTEKDYSRSKQDATIGAISAFGKGKQAQADYRAEQEKPVADKKSGGKSAAELAVDSTNKQLDAQLKLNSAQSALVDQQIKGSAILDMDLVNEAKRLDIEQAQLKYGKEILDAKGNATLVSAAQATLEFDTKTAIAKAENVVTEEKKKQLDIQKEKNALEIESASRQSAAEAELAQVKLDTNQNELNYLTSLGLLSANTIIAKQEEIELQRESVVLAQGIAQAQLAAQAARNQGIPEAEITAEYLRQVSVLTAQNVSKTAGIKLAAKATMEIERQRSLMDDLTKLTVQLGVAFGKTGSTIGNMAANWNKASQATANYEEQLTKLTKGTKEYSKVETQKTDSELEGYAAATSGVKSLFGEKTTAYKAFAAIEKSIAIARIALLVKEIFFTTASASAVVVGESTKTAASVAGSLTRTAAALGEAAANAGLAVIKAIASLPFPANIAAGVATAAVVYKLLRSIKGGSGSSISGGGSGGTLEGQQYRSDNGKFYVDKSNYYGEMSPYQDASISETGLAFQTRRSETSRNVSTSLGSLGIRAPVGVGGADWALSFVEAVGGLDKFIEQTTFFAENFLTEAERLAPVQTKVTTEMARLGYASVDTRDEFKNLVRGLDLSTESGKETYAVLMDLAPAFAEVYKEENKLLALKEKEISLKEKITAAYESESAAMKSTIATIQGSINSLTGFKSSLNAGANSNLTPAERYALARSEASNVARAAAQGDASAATRLPSVLDNLLSQSRVMNASGAGYASDFNYVQQLLDMSISGLEGQKTDAEKQLSILDATYSTLNIMKEQSFTMVQLMSQLRDIQTEEATIVRQDAAQKAEIIKVAEATERLRKQQEQESKDQIEVLRRGFMGVVAAVSSPSVTTTASSQPPLVNNPSYYVWSEPTGGA